MGCGNPPKALHEPVNSQKVAVSSPKRTDYLPIEQLERSVDSKSVKLISMHELGAALEKKKSKVFASMKTRIQDGESLIKEILPVRVIDLFARYTMENTSLGQRINNEKTYNKAVEKMKHFISKRAIGKLEKEEMNTNDLDIFNFLKLKVDDQGKEILPEPVMYKTLDNKQIGEVNYSFKFIKKYYKKQQPIEDDHDVFSIMSPEGRSKNTARRVSIMKKNYVNKFIDPLFPPIYDSIIGIRNGEYFDPDSVRREKHKNSFTLKKEDIVWLRPEEIFPGGYYCLFANDISVDDILQGNIGNCYFLSSLAAMTEIPQLIYQLFGKYDISIKGYYEIAVRIQGKWKRVIVDDYFPCYAKTRKPIFAKSRDSEIWVMLLEKVWAKVNGGYINTISGSSAQILTCFTSFSFSTLLHRKFQKTKKEEKLETLWNLIKCSDEAGYILTSNSYERSTVNSVDKSGIVSGHSYAHTQVKEAVIGGKKVRILNLRNPWGYKEWNGAWSDNSPEWSSEAKKAFGFKDGEFISSDDGKFWISFEDFLKFFSITNICRVYSPQCCQHFSIPKDKAEIPHIFELQLTHKNVITVSACKKYWRFYRKLPSDAELVINIIIVKKVTLPNGEVTVEYVASTHENEHDPTIECTLHEGSYFIYVHANYNFAKFGGTKRKYVLLVTSNKFFHAMPRGTDNETFDFLRGIVTARIESNYLKTPDDFTYSGNKFDKTTYGVLYIQNKTKDTYKILGKNMSENFELLTPKGIDKNINVMLEPGEKLLIIGIRKVYYEMFVFEWDIDPLKIEIGEKSNQTPKTTSFLAKVPKLIPIFKSLISESIINKINEDKYDFIFKKIDIDMSTIVTKIDFIDYSLNYFVTKYPEVSVIIEKVPELEDGEEVIFQDMLSLNPHTCYLGEWKVRQELVKHGRGMLIFSDGTYYMGQFVDDQNHGWGTLQYPSGEKIEINWEKGRMHGKGKHFKSDGTFQEVEYDNGKLISN